MAVLRAEPVAMAGEFTSLDTGAIGDHWRAASGDDLVAALGMESVSWEEGVPGTGGWILAEGVLSAGEPGGDWLATRGFIGDFDLRLEWRGAPAADAVIDLRGAARISLADLAAGAEISDGWNDLRVLMAGEMVSASLNGQWVMAAQRPGGGAAWDTGRVFRQGPLALAPAEGVEWRNIRVRDLSAEESCDMLRLWGGGEGFEPMFNGRDLQGWQGAIGHHEVREGGILHCKRGAAGNLVSEREFGDFEMRFDYQASPGGNSGLAIWSAVEGTPAWDAFEVQVLDDDAPQYANLAAYQYHGSLYGVKGARRGSIRHPGEWNHMRVRFAEGRVEVETNGFLIVDLDLSEVDRDALERVPRGMDVHRGYVGFTTHNDPFDFQNIEIKSLD